MYWLAKLFSSHGKCLKQAGKGIAISLLQCERRILKADDEGRTTEYLGVRKAVPQCGQISPEVIWQVKSVDER